MPGLLDPFTVPRADALAVIGLAALAVVLVAATRRRIAFTVLDAAVAAWCAVALLSTLSGIAPRLSWLGESGQREGLRTTLALAGLYAAARRAHTDARATRRTLDVVLGCAVLAAAYALLQCSGHDPFTWTRVAWYPAGAGGVLRPGSTVGNATILGTLLAAALALTVAQLAVGTADRSTRVPAAALLGVALIATLSRGAILGAIAGALVALVLAWRVRRTGAASRAAVALGSALLPALAWGALVLRSALAARASEGAGGESSPARVEIARSALAMWRAHPWLGVGPDAFGLAFPRVQTPGFWSREWLGLPAHAHSAPLQVLATGGVLAALAGLAWLGCTTMTLAREQRRDCEAATLAVEVIAPLAALAVSGLFNPLGMAGAALFAVLSAHGQRAPALHANMAARSPWPRVVWAAGVLALLVVGVPAVGEWRGQHEAAVAHGALEAMDGAPAEGRLALARTACRAAAAAASRARSVDELWRLACDADLARVDAALQLRHVEEARLSADAAELAAHRALALQADRASNHDRLANSLAARSRLPGQAGLMPAAEAEYAIASALAPCDALVLTDEARAQLLTRRYTQAQGTAERVVTMYPTAAQGHALEAAALMSMGRRELALHAADRALAARWEAGAQAQYAATAALRRALAAGGR